MTDPNDFRPTTWADYIGQERVKERLDLAIESAKNRGDRLPHTFLHAPPGAGKTTLAQIIAERAGRADTFRKFVMPVDERGLKRIVTECFGIVLFDELHRLSPKQQEMLLPLLEDGEFHPKSGFPLPNPYITIIGATTERGKIIQPLMDRFKIKPEFDDYTDDEMAQIAWNILKRAKLDNIYDQDFAHELGLASGGVPRHVTDLIVAIRDLIHSKVNPSPTLEDVLHTADVTHDGLSRLQTKYLTVLAYNGAPLGIKPLANHLQVSESAILGLEDLLLRRGYIVYTKTGRELTGPGHMRAQQLLGTFP